MGTPQQQQSDPLVYVYSPPDKDGKQTLGTVPQSQLSDVLNNGEGYRKAVMMTAPDGKTTGWVPPQKVPELLKPENGYSIGPASQRNLLGGTMESRVAMPNGQKPKTPHQLQMEKDFKAEWDRQENEIENQSATRRAFNVATGLEEAISPVPVVGPQLATADKAVQSFKKGNTSAGVGYTAATLVPGAGPVAAGAAEKVGEGDYLGAAADLAPLALGGVALIKSKHPVARAVPGLPSDAAEIASPHIQSAAQDMGIDLSKASADDVVSATQQAKQNILLNAERTAGEGKTIADLPPEAHAEMHQQIDALNQVEDAVGKAQETAAKNASSNAPTTRGQAAADVVKGAGKMVVADTAGRLIPGGRLVADAVGISSGGPQVVRGVKGILKPALTPEVLDARLQNAFGKLPESTVPGAPQELIAPRELPEPIGDTTVQHTSTPFPPEVEGGNLNVIEPSQRPPAQRVEQLSRAPVQETPQWQGPLPQREAIGEPIAKPEQPEAPQRQYQPFKAKTPQAAQTEVLKKAGVAAPKATQNKFDNGVPGPTLQPREFETFPEADGEKAAAQSLTHYTINELRAIAQQRGISVKAGDTHVDLIQKIHDDLTPEEIQSFHDAATKQAEARSQGREQLGFTPHGDNKAIADNWRQEADKLEAEGEKPYDVAAYRQGAHQIENHAQSIMDMKPEEIQNIPGIGKKLAGQIEDYRQQHTDVASQLQKSIDAVNAKKAGVSPETDNADVQQAKKELGENASTSDVLKRAQELKQAKMSQQSSDLRGQSERAFYARRAQEMADSANKSLGPNSQLGPEWVAQKAKELMEAAKASKK